MGNSAAVVGATTVSAAQWVGIAVFVALALVASTGARAIWRGDAPSLAEPTRFNRSLPACILTGWTTIAALPPTLYVITRTGD